MMAIPTPQTSCTTGGALSRACYTDLVLPQISGITGRDTPLMRDRDAWWTIDNLETALSPELEAVFFTCLVVGARDYMALETG